jgi:hypothetical protein
MLGNKLSDLQQGELNKCINIFFLYLFKHIVLNYI